MGCDFFIYTYLEIKHKEGICYIQLDRRDDWYCDCQEPMMDSDDEEENYKKKCDVYIENFLKPGFEPILIYDRDQFLSQNYIIKYFNLIQQKANNSSKYWRDSGSLLDINNIEQIRKIEIREKNC